MEFSIIVHCYGVCRLFGIPTRIATCNHVLTLLVDIRDDVKFRSGVIAVFVMHRIGYCRASSTLQPTKGTWASSWSFSKYVSACVVLCVLQK